MTGENRESVSGITKAVATGSPRTEATVVQDLTRKIEGLAPAEQEMAINILNCEQELGSLGLRREVPIEKRRVLVAMADAASQVESDEEFDSLIERLDQTAELASRGELGNEETERIMREFDPEGLFRQEGGVFDSVWAETSEDLANIGDDSLSEVCKEEEKQEEEKSLLEKAADRLGRELKEFKKVAEQERENALENKMMRQMRRGEKRFNRLVARQFPNLDLEHLGKDETVPAKVKAPEKSEDEKKNEAIREAVERVQPSGVGLNQVARFLMREKRMTKEEVSAIMKERVSGLTTSDIEEQVEKVWDETEEVRKEEGERLERLRKTAEAGAVTIGEARERAEQVAGQVVNIAGQVKQATEGVVDEARKIAESETGQEVQRRLGEMREGFQSGAVSVVNYVQTLMESGAPAEMIVADAKKFFTGEQMIELQQYLVEMGKEKLKTGATEAVTSGKRLFGEAMSSGKEAMAAGRQRREERAVNKAQAEWTGFLRDQLPEGEGATQLESWLSVRGIHDLKSLRERTGFKETEWSQASGSLGYWIELVDRLTVAAGFSPTIIPESVNTVREKKTFLGPKGDAWRIQKGRELMEIAQLMVRNPDAIGRIRDEFEAMIKTGKLRPEEFEKRVLANPESGQA